MEIMTHEQELQQASQQLFAAADLIERVMEMLNDESLSCSECGREHFVDLVEADARKQLHAARKKARQWALTLRSPELRAKHLAEREAAAELRAVPRRGDDDDDG